ncbi:MAG: hypothetical protein H7138_04235, partial [Myxococcales bacterium]|nr:hypothetical protein [Myxococcales bacterium]
MKLGVITTSYPRFARGVVAGHVAGLRSLGHRVEIIAAGDGTANAHTIDPT